MKAEDVTDTLQLALAASGRDQARVVHKPRLLSDNGSSYVSADLAEWLDDNGMRHVVYTAEALARELERALHQKGSRLIEAIMTKSTQLTLALKPSAARSSHVSTAVLCAWTPMNPRKHPIADTHDPIAYALEQAVGPMHSRRQPRFKSFATQTLPGLGAGGETKDGKGSRSREQYSAGHKGLH